MPLSYEALADAVDRCACALLGLGLGRAERVAVYPPKQIEYVVAMLGASRAAGAFVPVNPLLKAAQVAHILNDCEVRILVTSAERLALLAGALAKCPDLRFVIIVGGGAADAVALPASILEWQSFMQPDSYRAPHHVIDMDISAILYTSSRTGRPKGVVLSQWNMVTGAQSVASYLGNVPEDRLLAVLPFSSDYGLSQLTTAFVAGASVVLMNYLLPRDIVMTCARERITGLAGIPPLWSQLADLRWPEESVRHLRYLTNSGGTMPAAMLAKLRRAIPQARVFLMYGLTEAYRSTYLPPEDIDREPGSIGKAIPNAEILVMRPDGAPCAPEEPGELVHRGSLVALGYWNDREKTAERCRPAPGQPNGLVVAEIAV